MTFGERLPDLILLDVSTFDDDQVMHRMVADRTTPVIGLGIREADGEVVGWAERGLAGLLTRDASMDELMRAITSVVEHHGHCSPSFVSPLLRRIQRSRRRPRR